jgi:diguanylate cyclase (GGDEF)-like protein
MRHPAAVGDGEGLDDDGPAAAAGRGAEPQVAVTLAALLFLGGLLGSANLLVDGMVHDGVQRWIYGGTMALLGAAAVLLAVRRRATGLPTFGLVLLGDLVYVVVALCITDPVRYATPLMLLFPSFVAAWFLGRWGLAVTMVVTPLAVLVAMWSSYPDPAGLAIQVLVNAGMLDIAALGVFLLRRRVERLLEATQQLTATDPLTGLHNRRYLVDQAPRVWRQARRDGMRIAAMVLDLDHFKQLNDRYGHAAGDAVLRAVATALTGCVRPADVLARTGGEELVVVGMVGDAAEAGRLAERLRAAVAGTRTDAGHAVTASIGVALTRPFDGEDARNALWRLVDRADAAMYEAKQQGRDRVSALLVPHPAPVRAPVPPPLDDATTDVA